MENLLETASDIDLDYPDEDGRTPLLLAALHDRAAAARFLLARGADAEAVGRWPGPPDGPLATAAALGHVATMDALLEGGASANAATGPDGRTPLIAAAEAGMRKPSPCSCPWAPRSTRNEPTARRRRARRRRAATAMC